jgi:hypothetical protein
LSTLRNTEISPVPVIIAAVALVLVLGYFFWLRPSMEQARIAREWNSPQAAAQRGPGKPVNPAYRSAVQELLRKEGAVPRPSRKDAE